MNVLHTVWKEKHDELMASEDDFYYDDGSVRMEGEYKLGQMNGVWKTMDRKGNIRSTKNYINGIDSDIIQKQIAAKAEKEETNKVNAKSNFFMLLFFSV